MRRDVCHFYANDVVAVYNAYLRAIREKFKKDCKESPYHTIGFGLDFSLKYNMNGGGCNVHLMPYNGGTAVDIRYTIAQAIGARIDAHDGDLTGCVEKILGTKATAIQIDVEEFLRDENRRFAQEPTADAPAPAAEAPTPAAPTTLARFCPNCGRPFGETHRYCGKCGTKRGS